MKKSLLSSDGEMNLTFETVKVLRVEVNSLNFTNQVFFLDVTLLQKFFKVKSITFNILRTPNGRLNNSNLLFLCFRSAREYIF